MKIQEVVKSGLCLGCGICTFDDKISGMEFNAKNGISYPSFKKELCYDIANKICPAVGYSIKSEAAQRYDGNKYSIELGVVDEAFIARTISTKLLRNSSSGGLMTQIIVYLLEEKIVDKVAVTKFIYTSNGPRTKTFLTNNIDKIIESQGSKYCPVDISSFINEFKSYNGKIAFVGTPCQIAGIRNIQKFDTHFKNDIVLTIANFCGGYKSYNNIKKLALRHKINYNKMSYLRFRGGGQPGSLKMIDDVNTFEVPYPKYVGYTGYSKMLRCHLCVDATGELADIACGDAWLDKYVNDEYAWSVILTRSKIASEIIFSMKEKDIIISENVSVNQVIKSQNENLTSKKNRQAARIKLYSLLKYRIPDFNGEGYYKTATSLKAEILIYFTHKIRLIFEQCGLFPLYRKMIKRPY